MWEQEARPKRNPYCSRCRNHGKSAQVKGHKRHCEYRYCQCEGCKLVMCRQIVSAAQIKRRRYQKQDEECGRRIEVSPPVLTKTANGDPAALIAKTLIGSNKNCTVPYGCAGGGGGGGSSELLDVGTRAPPALTKTASSDPTALIAKTLIGSHKSCTAPDGCTDGGGGGGSSDLLDVGIGTIPVAQARLKTQLQDLMMGLPSFHQASGTSFRDAQQLFQFTTAFSQQHANLSNLLISSGAAPGASPIVPTSTSALLTGGVSPREQLNLVEEIHQNFGPLATFAWLRSEDFNVAKIRAMIEISRDAYEEMLQMNGHSALDLTSPIVDI